MDLNASLARLQSLPQLDPGTLHHFAGGVYCKQMHLPAGFEAVTHVHRYDHLSVLAAGVVEVRTDDAAQIYEAPAVIVIPAGVRHGIVAFKDAVWLCIHATEETDPARVDEVLIQKEH